MFDLPLDVTVDKLQIICNTLLQQDPVDSFIWDLKIEQTKFGEIPMELFEELYKVMHIGSTRYL